MTMRTTMMRMIVVITMKMMSKRFLLMCNDRGSLPQPSQN